jgi:excisionase family DNA binding protein
LDPFGLASQGQLVTDSTPAMTVREVAAYLNVNEKTVYRLAQRRELPGFKVAGAWRFRPEDIRCWVQSQKSDGKGDAR